MSRLTKKKDNHYWTDNLGALFRIDQNEEQLYTNDAIDKCGQLEDILEKYNINTNEELETLCKYAESVREWMSIYKEKLFEIRKIERKLGIDLIILFKASKKGIYIKKHPFKKLRLVLMREDYVDRTCRYFVFVNGKKKYLKLKDYSKTWALTKKELL